MRRLICCLLVVLATTTQARADDAVTFRLNWLIYGFHTPFFLGVDKGIYKQHGIDLTIGEGQGSGRAVQIVASGTETFGLADGASIINGVTKGAPVVAVMGIMNRSPYGISVRADSGITDLKGLVGKTLAATTGEAGLVMFPAILKRNGLAPDAIGFLRVDGEAKMVAVLQNRTVGMLSGVENQALILPRRGVAVRTFPYPSLGVNTMGLAIVVAKATVDKNPDLLRRFIAATREAFDAAIADPDASIAAGMKVKPDMDRDLAMAQLKAGLTLVHSPHGEDKPIGWMAAQDWAETLQLMTEYQDLKTDLPATAFWTDAYLPR
ncbi:MAG: ABC transporter substrate-binding protein [Rhodopila sp.]|nr:ABC transporter substrate-binding protein [Rhodopila sp.]